MVGEYPVPQREYYDKLKCDECEKEICMAHENDLNGSYFICFDCWNTGKTPELKSRGY